MRFLIPVVMASLAAAQTTSGPVGWAPSKAASLIAGNVAQCNIQYTQSVVLNGNQLTAKFTPATGAAVPTFVDFHVTKNCPGNPTASNGQCATPWYQPPFDEAYALNLHASGIGAYSMEGASYNGRDFLFNFDISTVALGPDDKLCYDFTYAYGNLGCDTGVCSLAPPTPAGFSLLPTTCDALTYTQNLEVKGNQIIANFIPDAGKVLPTWVDLHVSKNCPGAPVKSNSTCATPWYQPPFDNNYALNLHSSQDVTQFTTPGASYANGVYSYNFDATVLLSTFSGSDFLCYDFTYAYGNLGCDSGVCSLIEPSTPSTSPIVVGVQPSCSQVQYTQSVTVTGSQVLATFTPTTGSTIPTFVDFHITKNCPGNPTTATGQCATEWYQPPFDSSYALNLHNSAIGTYSSQGAIFNPTTKEFTFIFDASTLTNTLTASDKLCYDFTYVMNTYGCDTGVCAVNSTKSA